MILQVQANSSADHDRLKKDMAATQAELTKVRQEAAAAGVSTKEMLTQQQVLISVHLHTILMLEPAELCLDMEASCKSPCLPSRSKVYRTAS